jgi:threonine dehydratase
VGIATALAAVRPVVRIIGRQAAGAPAMRVADVGHCVRLECTSTISEGVALKSPSPGPRTPSR